MLGAKGQGVLDDVIEERSPCLRAERCFGWSFEGLNDC